jgi:hypothetical protein
MATQPTVMFVGIRETYLVVGRNKKWNLKLLVDYRINGEASSSAAAADWDEYRCQLYIKEQKKHSLNKCTFVIKKIALSYTIL